MEPNWLTEPEAPNALPHLPLTRIKPGAASCVMLTSSRLLGVKTHYMGRRTLPCVEKGCPGCELELPGRPEWYAAAFTYTERKHIIVAMTPAVAWLIRDGNRQRESLRTLVCVLSRAGKAANSRLLVTFREPTSVPAHLPAEPDLIAHLLHIWGLDQNMVGQDEPGYVNRVKEYYRGNGSKADATEAG